MGQHMPKSDTQYLPEFVQLWYWWKTDWRPDHIVLAAVLASAVSMWLALAFQVEDFEYCSLGIGFATLILNWAWFSRCERHRNRAVDWVDRRMAKYGLMPEQPDGEQMDQILAALAHLVHDSSDTDTAHERKAEFRQAKGLMELRWGVGNTYSISELRERFPLMRLKKCDSLISSGLRTRLESIQDHAA